MLEELILEKPVLKKAALGNAMPALLLPVHPLLTR